MNPVKKWIIFKYFPVTLVVNSACRPIFYHQNKIKEYLYNIER